MGRTEITQDEIEAAKSPKGGFKRDTLAEWGVPWPPPKGWRKTILRHGIPYAEELNTVGGGSSEESDLNVTQDSLERMMDASVPHLVSGEPQDCEGDLDIDPAQLLRKVVSAVISAGRSDILWEFPEVLAFFNARIPDRHEVEHHHRVDERMFDVKANWPNLKKG